MSGNHNQSLDRSLEIVRAAADCGVQAVKIQTYTPDTMTLNVKLDDFFISDQDSPWYGRYLYDLYQDAYAPWEWHKEIMEESNRLGLICFSTPFDESAVDFLEDLDVPAYKIASFENTDLSLIRKVASTGKPLLISCGLASLAELEETVDVLREEHCTEFALLKCTTSYPALAKHSNILTIPEMRKRFGCEVGLSDHSMGIGVAIAAVSHGAVIIEKHFTLNRQDGGVDSSFSMEPEELKLLADEATVAWEALGGVHYGPTESELHTIKSRRSLYIAEDMESGDILTKDNLRKLRPGFGLATKHYNLLLGRKVTRQIAKGTALSWEMVEEAQD
jgi:N-acetylneuraminate synthase